MSKSSNGKNAQKKTYELHFERYVQERAYAEVEAGSLAEAAEIARNMTWDDVDGLDFYVDVVVDEATRLYSIASEDGKERISVSDVEKDRSKILHIEACSLIGEPYVDRIRQVSDIASAGKGDSQALARLLDDFASLSCKRTGDLVWLLRIARCIRVAGGMPSSEHASSWLSHLEMLRHLAANQDADLIYELRGDEDLIAWMASMAEKSSLANPIRTDGVSARQSASL